MTYSMNSLRIVLATLALLVSSLSAWALDATSDTWLNVRSGPSTGYEVVDTLFPGERVTIEECEASGWCLITRTGPNGWVSSSYLSPVVEEAEATPDCRFELTIGQSGPSLSIICGSQESEAPPSPPPSAQACFYTGPNYSGDEFCRGVGTSNTLAAEFNNEITAVRLFGGARARLCVGTNLSGACLTVATNKPLLDPMINNQASSLRVFTGMLPPPLPPLHPLPPPPFPPTTHSTGPISLAPMQSANLDNGAIGGSGVDIRYMMITPVNRRLQPLNGAQLARGDGTNRGLAGCAGETFSVSSLPFSALGVGTYVCVRTDEGRVSQFRVNGYSGLTLNIGYTTWAN